MRAGGGCFALALLVSSLLPCLCCNKSWENGPVVHLPRLGYYGGVHTADGGAAFRGIRYAQPPVEELRFRAPKPWIPTEESDCVIEATDFGPSCVQASFGQLFPFAVTSGLPRFTAKLTRAEDCLTLNIWTPALEPTEPLPVMIWLHGGGFVFGGANLPPLYDGHKLSARGAVVVTLNYRLGPLGFLALEDLAEDGAVGNYGLLDQALALKWVKEHVLKFGGDPDRITVFGESAGSFSICCHLAAEPAPVFHRAILQSGPCGVSFPTLDIASRQARLLASTVGCSYVDDVASCLRHVDAQTLADALAPKRGFMFHRGAIWVPVITPGVGFLQQQLPSAFLSDTWHKLPLILGSTEDEGSLFVSVLGFPIALTEHHAKMLVADGLRERAHLILEHYDLSHPFRNQAELSRMMGDGLFVCGADFVARHAANASVATFVFLWKHLASFNKASFLLGSHHGSEIPFVFGNLLPYAAVARWCTHTLDSFSPEEDTLIDTVQRYYINFAIAGDPNGPHLPQWPVFDAAAAHSSEPVWLSFEDHAAPIHRAKVCDAWAKVHRVAPIDHLTLSEEPLYVRLANSCVVVGVVLCLRRRRRGGETDMHVCDLCGSPTPRSPSTPTPSNRGTLKALKTH